jgi:hypothetical protein
MSPYSELKPGEWYLLVVCQNCQARHSLFHDLTKGEGRIVATYRWTCPDCKHTGEYESEKLERYRHACAK